jgi:elongation factor Ts
MMSTITASQVKELREATNVGMMECKKALTESGGDLGAAIKLLRERGMAIADKKASRVANEGLIASDVVEGGKIGVIVEVNCETDFVARNESFQAFVADLVQKGLESQGSLAELYRSDLTAKIAEIGENLVIRRNDRFDLQGTGTVASYIHLGEKVGVLLEVGCGKEETVASDAFKEAVKDITLHIAACSPEYQSRDDVPEDTLASEREIFAKQAEGKPENIIGKIVDGKLDKFFEQRCLLEQPFVKDGDLSITQLLAGKGKELGDDISVRRFVRYQIGA